MRDLKKDSKSPDEIEAILKYLKMIETESDRCGTIIKNLLLFSKKYEPEFKPRQLNNIIETTLLLVNHHFRRLQPCFVIDDDVFSKIVFAAPNVFSVAIFFINVGISI